MGATSTISKYVQEPNRINVGLTRCQFAWTVVCHIPSIQDTAKSTAAALYVDDSALALLVEKADECGCVVHSNAIDDRPRAAEEAEALSRAAHGQKSNQQLNRQMSIPLNPQISLNGEPLL